MSKVFEYFNELEKLNGPVEEPTDTELAEIEADAEHQAMLREFEQEVLDFPELYE